MLSQLGIKICFGKLSVYEFPVELSPQSRKCLGSKIIKATLDSFKEGHRLCEEQPAEIASLFKERNRIYRRKGYGGGRPSRLSLTKQDLEIFKSEKKNKRRKILGSAN